MSPEQLIQLVKDLRPLVNNVVKAGSALDALLTRVEIKIDQAEPLNVPLTQAQVDAIIAVYSPLYAVALHDVEASGDALNSDVF